AHATNLRCHRRDVHEARSTRRPGRGAPAPARGANGPFQSRVASDAAPATVRLCPPRWAPGRHLAQLRARRRAPARRLQAALISYGGTELALSTSRIESLTPRVPHAATAAEPVVRPTKHTPSVGESV